jgi:hypothetical protein
MLAFAFASVSAAVRRSPALDDSLVPRITDANRSTLFTSSTRCLVFFHADHSRLSDLAYLKFIHVIRDYSGIIPFYVAPSALNTELSRRLRVSVFPSLCFIFNENYTTRLHGSFSFDSLSRFLENCTRPAYTVLQITSSTTHQDIISRTTVDEFDESSVVFLLSDTETRFGRLSVELTETFPPLYRMIKIENPLAGRLFGTRVPSIIFYRHSDDTQEVYEGAPLLGEMVHWLERVGVSRLKLFDVFDLFAKDGLPVKLVLNFVRRSERKAAFPILREEARRFPGIISTFAEPDRYRQFLSMFEHNDTSKRVCLLSTFLSIGHTDCETLDSFASNAAPLRYFTPPRSLYGYAVSVNELGFRELLRTGPLFVAFDVKGCESCNERAGTARTAAIRVSQFGSRTNWCIWDTDHAAPSFAGQLELPMPSLWYFPSEQVSKAVFYRGRADVVSIVRWAHAQIGDFDLSALLQRESELAQQ